MRWKCALRVLQGSRNYAPPGRLCEGPQFVKSDLKIQSTGTVRRCEDIIKTDFKTNRSFECRLGSLAQGRVQLRAVVNKVMNI